MRRAVRFSRVVSDAVHIECRDTRDGLLQSWRFPRHPEVLPQAIDLHMVATLKMARLMTGTHVTLARLWRRHRPAPEVVAEYEAFFACPMEFGAEHDAFLVPHALARQRLPMANPALALESDAAVQSYLARFDGSLFADRTREAILQQLPSGEPQRATVARALGLSEKTLQRRLASENTSFANLVNEARVELARRYVLDPGLRLGDIAFRLGFAEQSGFTRAFKRWTGQSPAEFREAHKKAAESDAREASSR
jgi:AraC-like DNA-binding protein